MKQRRKRREDHLDARVNQRALDLYKLGKAMLAQGFRDDSREFYEVCNGLHRSLSLRPWQPDIFDFELYIMEPESYPPHADFHVVEELHRRLAAVAGGAPRVKRAQASRRVCVPLPR